MIYSHNTFTTVAEGNGLTVTVMVAESANYLGAVETVEISVAPMKVTLPEYQTSLAYTAETVELLESGEYYSVEGGSAVERGDYVATVILKDPENCVWEDADFMGTIEWKII